VAADYSVSMKHTKSHPDQTQPSAKAPRPTLAAKISPDEMNFTPSSDEVARKAYFTYVNQGSLDGHEVQHWLQAEADLISERNRTRTHGFPNRS